MDNPEKLDLSALTFDEFVKFYFQHPPDREYWYRDPAYEYGNVDSSKPLVVIDHATRLFMEFGTIAPNYFLAQIDHGVWALLADSGPLSIQELLWNSSIPVEGRVACIRSMSHVYSDFVAGYEEDDTETCFNMWWDLLGHGFWSTAGLTRSKDIALLNPDQKSVLDAMFDTLKRILSIPDQRVQWYALHGLGHLHHPAVAQLVQKFIDQNRSHLSDDSLKWVEQCRDGSVM